MSKILVEKTDANLVSFVPMTDKEIPRSIRFPESLWNAIDADARRCKRSSVKQMESILSAYYNIENVEIDLGKIDNMRSEQSKAEIERDYKLKTAKIIPHHANHEPFISQGEAHTDLKPRKSKKTG